jgi:hypothetical protein
MQKTNERGRVHRLMQRQGLPSFQKINRKKYSGQWPTTTGFTHFLKYIYIRHLTKFSMLVHSTKK